MFQKETTKIPLKYFKLNIDVEGENDLRSNKNT